jgi:hypothetical protein
VHVYNGEAQAAVTVQLWDLRGLHKRMILSRTFQVQGAGQQKTAFRWQLNRAGAYVGHTLLPANLLRQAASKK